MDFKDILKLLRSNNQMTQEDLAKKIGLTQAAIGLYEQGRREPDNETLKKIARCFNVSIDYLIGFEEERTPSCLIDLYHSENPKENKVIELIKQSQIPEDKLDLLMNMIESWDLSKKN